MKKCQKNDECPSCQAVHFCPMAVVSLFKNTLHNSLNYSRTSNAMIHDAKKANTWGSTLQTSVFFTQAHLRQDGLHKQGNFRVPVKMRKNTQIHKYRCPEEEDRRMNAPLSPVLSSFVPILVPLSSPIVISRRRPPVNSPTPFNALTSNNLQPRLLLQSLHFLVNLLLCPNTMFCTLGVSALHCLNFCVPVQYFHVFCVLA